MEVSFSVSCERVLAEPCQEDDLPKCAASWYSSPKRRYLPSVPCDHYFAHTPPFYLELSKQAATHLNLFNKT